MTGPTPTTDQVARPRAERRGAASAGPVFVDASGRRRRLLRRASLMAAVAVGGYAVVLGLSFLGGPVPPNALLPIGGASAGPSAPGSATARNSPTTAGPASAPLYGVAPGVGVKTAQASTGVAAGGATSPTSASAAASTSSTAAAASPSPSPSPSPSATGHQPTAPPGQVGKSATATAPGHGH